MPQQVQRPTGPSDKVCPLHRKKMSDVCHACPLWIQVRGKHPQTEAEVDMWDCSLAWMPLLLIENSQMQRQTGAAVESFRNEMVKANEATISLVTAQNGTKLIGADWPPR
jgi:hypothetical protein